MINRTLLALVIPLVSLGAHAEQIDSAVNFNVENTGLVRAEIISNGQRADYSRLKLLDSENSPLTQSAYIRFNAVKSDLSYIETVNVDNFTGQIFKGQSPGLSSGDLNGKCEAYYLTYHIKGNKYPEVSLIIKDSGGEVSSSGFDSECKEPSISKSDSIIKNINGITTGFFWNRPILSLNREVGFTATFQKEGSYFLPSMVNTYVIKDDFSSMQRMRNEYPSNVSNLLAFTGVKFATDIETEGNYFFIMETHDKEGSTVFKSKKEVHK